VERQIYQDEEGITGKDVAGILLFVAIVLTIMFLGLNAGPCEQSKAIAPITSMQ